jgi:formylglycine-generating enzyme required for sulfatase activity
MCALYRLRLRKTDAAWQASAARAQSTVKGYEFEPELVTIPKGPFWLGSDRNLDREALSAEMPAGQVSLPAYSLSRTPVTNAQYAAFVQATGHLAPSHWQEGKPPRGREQYPVVRVSWYDAVAYCEWLAGVTGKPYRLPTEAEWEKGARGTDGQTYPWGDEWDARNGNTKEGGKEDAMPVGAYPRGASPYGLLDMAGNVWEWTSSLYVRYPYRAEDGREDMTVPEARVLRGGSWLDSADRARCAARRSYIPAYHSRIHGFRICVSVIESTPR